MLQKAAVVTDAARTPYVKRPVQSQYVCLEAPHLPKLLEVLWRA